MTRIFATAALVVALAAGAASASPAVSVGGKALLSTTGGTAVVSVATPWHLVAWGASIVAAGYVAFNSIRLLNGASGG